MSEQNGEERGTVTTALARRSKPELVWAGEGNNRRQVSSVPRFTTDVCVQFVLENSDRWLTVGDLARCLYHANNPRNKDRVRRRLSEAFNDCLISHRRLLIYEFDGQRISAVKIFDPASELDRQLAKERVERMAKRFQWTRQRVELVRSVLEADTTA